MKLLLMDQLILDLMSTKTSSAMLEEFTSTLLEDMQEDMQSKSSVMELMRLQVSTTGLLPTHGELDGENKDSSELLKANVTLILMFGSHNMDKTLQLSFHSDSYQRID